MPDPTPLPYPTIGDVLTQLDLVIARCIEKRSKLGYFAVLYRNVTQRVLDNLHSGRFDDPARMERLDILFAHRYLHAYDQFSRGEAPTRSWTVVFDAAPRWSPNILQHLLLGINAHINLDLAIAAAATAQGEDLPALKHDFDEISGLLIEMLEDMQARIGRVSPWFGLFDRVGRSADEQLGALGLRGSRLRAWQVAEELSLASPDELPDYITLHDNRVALLAHAVYVPSLTLRGTHLLIRLRESDDVPHVMEMLRT